MNNSKKKEKKAKRVLGEILKILGMLLCCALLGIYLAIGARASSPKRFAKEFFSYYVTNNYEEMYKMIDCEESQFVNFDTYKTKCEGEKIYGSITGYTLSSPVENGNTVTFVASYTVGDDDTERTYTITLNKQKKKVYLFFNTWKVSVSRSMIENLNIDVPTGAQVSLDGINIDSFKKSTSSEDGGQDQYQIDHIFTGDHTVTVNMGDSTISKTQYITPDMATISVTSEDFALKPDVQRKIYDYSVYVVNSMFEYSMDETKNFENISVLYSGTEEAQQSAKETFETVSSGVVQENGAALKQLEIKAVEPQIVDFVYPDQVTVRVNYDYSYTAVTGTSALSGIVSEFSGEGSDYADVYFNLMDDDWKIVKVDMKCFEYKPQ
ncbi:MAG: hypothetical protein II919_07690 [Lachnospiraceae bacterium]|nr:hypothetical protein [Lachnospiraceae bacterium]